MRAKGAFAEAERRWYLFAISGAVSAVMGVLVLAYPDPSIKLLGVFLGIDLLIVSVLMIVRGLSTDSDSDDGPVEALLGMMGVIAGLLVIRNPGESLTLLALAFAIFLIVVGAVALGHAIVRPGHRMASLARGVVLVAAGSVIIAWPDIGLTTLVVLTGIALLLQGATEIVEAFLLRSVGRASAQH